MRSNILLSGVAATLALMVSPTSLLAAGAGGGGSGSGVPSESAPRYDAAAEYQKGTEALKAERYADAVTAFRRTLEVVPRNANAQYLLGFAYMQQGDYKKARGPLEKAVKYDEALIPAWRDLAITRHKLGEADKAQAALDALVARQGTCAAASCTDKAALDAAVAAVRAAMAGSTQSARDGLAGFGLADARTGDTLYLAAVGLINEHRYAEALGELAVAARHLGPHPDILTYQGFAYRKLQRFDLAETYYRRALAAAPDHLGALEYYGELKVERGDLAGARAHLARLDQLCRFGCYEAEELGRWIAAAPAS